MQVLLSRFFSLFFSDVIQCAQFVCTFENLCHILSCKWQWQSGLTVLDMELESCHSLSLMDCSLVRFSCATPSTSVKSEKRHKRVECWNGRNDQTLFLLPYLEISYHI